MIKFVKKEGSGYRYDNICTYKLPSVTPIVLNYIGAKQLKYIGDRDSVIYGILKKMGLK